MNEDIIETANECQSCPLNNNCPIAEKVKEGEINEQR